MLAASSSTAATARRPICYDRRYKRGRPGTTPSGRVPLTNRPGGCGKFLANLLPIEPSVPENPHITCCWGLDRERTTRARPPDARLLLFPHPVTARFTVVELSDGIRHARSSPGHLRR